MRYTDAQVSILQRLHGMLEFDPITTEEEFVKIFRVLHEAIRIPPEEISERTGLRPQEIRDWLTGQNIPPDRWWPQYSAKIRSFIWQVVEEHEGV